MRQMLAICFFELKRLLKRPRSYLIMFVTPLVFTSFFGGLLGGEGSRGVPIALVDLDQSTVSKSLGEQWKKEKMMSLQVTDVEQANQLRENKKNLRDDHYSAKLSSPAGGGEKGKPGIYP